MNSARINEENLSGHGNQRYGASPAPEAHGSQASGACSTAPQLARRKGRSFGASVIAHMRPTEDCQTALCPKLSTCGPHADSTNTVTTAQKAAGPFTTVSTPEIPPNTSNSKDEAIGLDAALQQSTPSMTSRRSHGAAMIASLAPAAATPNTGPPGSTKPPVMGTPRSQCMKACPSAHLPATVPEPTSSEPVLDLNIPAHQAPLPQAAPPLTQIKPSEGNEVHNQGLTESRQGRFIDEDGREPVVRALPAAIVPASPKPTIVQAQNVCDSQAALEPPADLTQEEGVATEPGIPGYSVPLHSNPVQLPPAVLIMFTRVFTGSHCLCAL